MRDRPVPLPALLLLFVLSGAAGLIYEVVWARQLVLVFGNTSQAVSTILTGFFGGLAIGGAVGGRVADRVARPLRLYGVLELIVVVVVLLTPLTLPAHRRGVPRHLPGARRTRRSRWRWCGSRSRSSRWRPRRCSWARRCRR